MAKEPTPAEMIRFLAVEVMGWRHTGQSFGGVDLYRGGKSCGDFRWKPHLDGNDMLGLIEALAKMGLRVMRDTSPAKVGCWHTCRVKRGLTVLGHACLRTTQLAVTTAAYRAAKAMKENE